VADAIFISYRRNDSEGEAGRLFDDLTRAFGEDAVFMDVAGIKPGVDFRKAIDENVTSCGVFLAIVGPTWATIATPEGKRRLDDPNDFVALEIASALRREVPVIPVLVHDAKMPSTDLLPAALQPFAYRNSVELTHVRWNSDVALLIEALKAYVTPKSSSELPVHANVPVLLPAPHPPSRPAIPAGTAKNKPTGLVAGAAIAAVLVIAAIVYFAVRPSAHPTPAPTPNPTPASTPTSAPATSPTPTQPIVAMPPAPAPATRQATDQRAALPVATYDGTWVRAVTPPPSNILSKLIVSGSGSGIAVHAFGNCEAAGCDWGVQPGALSGANVIATFALADGGRTTRTAMVTVHPVPSGLDVFVHNTYQGPTPEAAKNIHMVFVRAP